MEVDCDRNFDRFCQQFSGEALCFPQFGDWEVVWVAQTFLIVNALLCFGLARLAIKTEVQSA